MSRPSYFRTLVHGVFLEALRRQDGWVLLLFTGLFGAAALSLRVLGLDSPAEATFMLDLGLVLATGMAHLFTLLLAARQLPREIETRTIYPLLARPLPRVTLLTAKGTAAGLCGLFAFLPMFFIVWFTTPHPQPLPAGALIQHLALLGPSLAFTAALGLLLSLLLPGGLALFTGLLLVYGGEPLVRWGAERFAPLYALPRIGALNLVTRYTDGLGTLPADEFTKLLIYALGWTALLVGAAAATFERRSL